MLRESFSFWSSGANCSLISVGKGSVGMSRGGGSYLACVGVGIKKILGVHRCSG